MGKADGETNPQFSSEARKDQKVLYKFQKVSPALSDVPIVTGVFDQAQPTTTEHSY